MSPPLGELDSLSYLCSALRILHGFCCHPSKPGCQGDGEDTEGCQNTVQTKSLNRVGFGSAFTHTHTILCLFNVDVFQMFSWSRCGMVCERAGLASVGAQRMTVIASSSWREKTPAATRIGGGVFTRRLRTWGSGSTENCRQGQINQRGSSKKTLRECFPANGPSQLPDLTSAC